MLPSMMDDMMMMMTLFWVEPKREWNGPTSVLKDLEF